MASMHYPWEDNKDDFVLSVRKPADAPKRDYSRKPNNLKELRDKLANKLQKEPQIPQEPQIPPEPQIPQEPEPEPEPCQSRVNHFCYICGDLMTSKYRCKMHFNLQCAYQAYFNREIENQDKWWAPKFCCKYCRVSLIGWYNRAPPRKGMKFAIPMIWREPTGHDVDCYFCLQTTKPSRLNRYGIKKAKYPQNASSSRPIPHSEENPVPESPIPVTQTVSVNEDRYDDDVQILDEDEKPQPFTEADLKVFFEEIGPISQLKKDIIRQALLKRNLIVKRSNRVRRSGTLKRYLDTHSDKLDADGTIQPDASNADDDDSENESDDESDSSMEHSIKKQKPKDPDFLVSKRLRTLHNGNKVSDRKQMRKIKTISLNCPVTECGGVCGDNEELELHLAETHRVEKYHCVAPGCSFSFKKNKELSDHRKEFHADLTVWQCGRCPSKNKTAQILRRHIYFNHQFGHFKCTFSPECSFEQHNVNRHTMIKHKLDIHYKSKYVCQHEGCDKSFSSFGELKNHLKIHDPDQYKTHKCDQCEKTFWGDSDLQRHRLLHAGIKPHQCDHCGKRFTLKGSRDKHVKSLHPETVQI